jgi:heterotetrameric sarcosine oxidase gamma subunit
MAIALPKLSILFITTTTEPACMLKANIPALVTTTAIAPLPPRRICSLASPKADGLDLPKAGHRRGNIIWNAPNSWLVLDEDAASLQARTGGAVTDQSDGLLLLAVSGPHARDILKRLVPIDLRANEFPEDAAAITHAAHIGVRIWREEQIFILACFRSFAESLHHALAEAEAAVTRG